jgi:CPA2 family monovalent cation:H+ antiporter-2
VTHAPLLADLVVLLVVSIVVLYASHLVRLPPIVGFLVSGMLLGPYGLGLIRGVEQVEQLAEIGVVLLLFTIGIEFSLANLMRMRRSVLLGGSLQVLGVTASVYALAVLAGLPQSHALFLGMTASLSSTAVVLTLFQQAGEIEAPHGRMSLAMLVYQDLMIVPMMLLVPVLAGTGSGLLSSLGVFVVQAAIVLVLVLVLGHYVVPQLLDRVVYTRSRDLFLLTIVTVCLVVAWVSSLAGLSLALGAFLAGLLVSESEYSHQALADILPFRDLFAAFFFISIGMLLDLDLVVGQPLFLVGLVAALLALKVVAAAVATLAVGSAVRTGVITGMAMSQVGEFSFVLAGAGLAAGVMTTDTYQWFVAVAVATIGVTPFMMAAAPGAADFVARLPFADRRSVLREEASAPVTVENHLVVIGYGVNGRNVSKAAELAGVPYVVIDMNPSLVAAGRLNGVPIHYGDATRAAMLEHIGVRRARAVVIVLSDAAVTRQVTALVRGMNVGCTIVARTRYVREVEALRALGADTVIPEELETSVQIVSRVLASYLVPRSEIESFVSEIRAGDYEIWRSPVETGSNLLDLSHAMPDLEVTSLRVQPGSPLAGQRLSESDLRRVYGVTVVAIRRGEGLLANPSGDTVVEADDVLVVLGLGEEILAASVLVTKSADA